MTAQCGGEHSEQALDGGERIGSQDAFPGLPDTSVYKKHFIIYYIHLEEAYHCPGGSGQMTGNQYSCISNELELRTITKAISKPDIKQSYL